MNIRYQVAKGSVFATCDLRPAICDMFKSDWYNILHTLTITVGVAIGAGPHERSRDVCTLQAASSCWTRRDSVTGGFRSSPLAISSVLSARMITIN